MQRLAIPNRLQGSLLERDAHNHCWMLWLHTNDHKLGTYLRLHDDGTVYRVTCRVDEGDQEFLVKPSDKDIHDEG